MIKSSHPEKPPAVADAEKVLWVWTAWTCLFGFAQSYFSIPEIEDAITSQLQGMIAISPQTLIIAFVVCYVAMGVLSAWIIPKIGAGKHWARSSLMWGFAIQLLYTACPPYKSFTEYLPDVPDLGLQIYAIYLLYSKAAHGWFPKPSPA